MNFFSKAGVIFDNNNVPYSNLAIIEQFPLKKHFLKTYVLQNEQYRPDLISFRLFNNVNYAWVIDEMNNFYHGFKEYEAGREIFYLKKEDLNALGFIR